MSLPNQKGGYVNGAEYHSITDYWCSHDSHSDHQHKSEQQGRCTQALHNAGNFVVVRTVDTSLSHAELCHLSAEVLRTEALDWFNKYGK